MKKKVSIVFILIVSISLSTCTDLEEEYGSKLTIKQVSKEELHKNLIASLKTPFQNFSAVIALSELSTDELIAPTRATDWDDNGIWRSLHQHRWNSEAVNITGCFNSLSGVVFTATDFLKYNLTPAEEAEARFYRAWAMYWILDFFDQVPYRDPGESTLLPARVRKGVEALDYIISEVNDILKNLPDDAITTPSKNAAKVFLMKCYLNKAVYINRQSPAFDVVDMNRVIALADDVINSGLFSFSDNYFDNFAPDNATLSKENIFTQSNEGGVFGNTDLFFFQLIPLHYASTPSGFNGWATQSDFVDKFEATDKRRGQAYTYPGGPPNSGQHINIGFLVGQQYNLFDDQPLTDGVTNTRPLQFTREVRIIETSENLRVTGIRPQKYAIDFKNHVAAPDNDWVYFRLPDVLLMKAEAILRGGTPTTAGVYGSTALSLVNSIRTHPSRGASALSSVDFNILLDERGRELWLECWRRQDLIRFGKFLDPMQEKNYVSDSKCLLFPIPSQQVAVNPKYLRQNPGY